MKLRLTTNSIICCYKFHNTVILKRPGHEKNISKFSLGRKRLISGENNNRDKNGDIDNKTYLREHKQVEERFPGGTTLASLIVVTRTLRTPTHGYTGSDHQEGSTLKYHRDIVISFGSPADSPGLLTNIIVFERFAYQ